MEKVMPVIDRVNIMSYDLINGYSTVTGHHPGLYSTPVQKESADKAVRYLDSLGIPRNKLVIGAAFYARVFEGADSVNNGLNRPAKFKSFVPYRIFPQTISQDSGYAFYWDDVAKAPYAYNADKSSLPLLMTVCPLASKQNMPWTRDWMGLCFGSLPSTSLKMDYWTLLIRLKTKKEVKPIVDKRGQLSSASQGQRCHLCQGRVTPRMFRMAAHKTFGSLKLWAVWKEACCFILYWVV